uniref:ShKT domain-containing protein n=1 Tax=Strongyloides papillosus TaxID=174720 RepID=A0A0N5BA23_STREA
MFILYFVISTYLLYHVIGIDDKCVDQNPYCTKNDCTVRPGYAREYCKKTCGDCKSFCQDSTYISCTDTKKDDCNDVLKEYCPILCGICEGKNNNSITTTNSTSTTLPEVKILKVEKNDTTSHGKTLKDDATHNSEETFSQGKTLRSDNWYNKQHNRKMLGQPNRYYGTQLRYTPQNINFSPSTTQVVDPLVKEMSDSFVEQESFSNPNIAMIGNDNINVPFNTLSQREGKIKEIVKDPTYGNDYKIRRRPQNIENMIEKESDDEYEDYEDQPRIIPNKKKIRGNKQERMDENAYLQNSIFPFNQKSNLAQNRAVTDNEHNSRNNIKSTEEMEEKVSELPPLAIADLILLLGCRDRDQQICSKITEEACRARPGFYLRICPVRCKNCNGLLCMDSNKVDCLEVKRLGGCRLQMSEEYCPKTCNVCPTPTILAETTSLCKDEMDTCEQLADSGVCNNPVSIAAMRVYCAKSCNFCKNTHLYLSNSEEDDHPSELNALWMLKKQERNLHRHPQRNPRINSRH